MINVNIIGEQHTQIIVQNYGGVTACSPCPSDLICSTGKRSEGQGDGKGVRDRGRGSERVSEILGTREGPPHGSPPPVHVHRTKGNAYGITSDFLMR